MQKLKNLIAQDFKGKRLAILDRLKQKFDKERGLVVGGDSDTSEEKNLAIENDIANQTIADIETHKKRVETLFEYSNIVSSFLQVEDAEGNIVGQNTTSRNEEIKSQSGNEKFEEYFGGMEESTNSAGAKIEYLQAIDQLISFKEVEEDESADQSTDSSSKTLQRDN